jgi:ribosome-associated protein
LGRSAGHARFAAIAGDKPLKAAKKPVKKATKSSAKKPAPKPSKAKKAAPRKSAKPQSMAKAKAKPKKIVAPKAARPAPQSDLLKRIVASLEDDKAEAIVTIDLAGRSSLCDAAVIANGRSSRHVMSIAEHLARRLKEQGYGTRPVTGASQGDWVLVDAGDIIVHVFRPEVRDYYDLEGMWNVASPSRG